MYGGQPQVSAPNDAVARGLEHFYNLEYPEALREFRAALEASPKDPDRHNYVAQAILFNLMLRNGALESEMVTGNNPFLRRPKMNPTPEEEAAFRQAVASAVALTQPRLARDPRDKAALYAEGVALALRGNYNFLVNRAWLDALRDITAARKLHHRLTEIDPGMVDARFLEGAHDYVVGSLPIGYRMLGFLAGFTGDRTQGIRTIQTVATRGVRNRIDAQILLGVIYRRERRPADAISLIDELLRLFPRNYLFQLELCQMYSDLGDKASALAALDRAEQLKRTGAPGYRSLLQERIDFARGNLLFWYNDLEPAMAYLAKAAARAPELDPNTGALSFMRLGQCNDLLGRRSRALESYRQAVAVAPQSDAARESRRYLSSPYRRPAKA